MRRRLGLILSFLGLVLLCTALYLTLREVRESRSELACESVHIVLKDSLNFITTEQVNSWLQSNYGICVGKRINELNLRYIEEVLLEQGPIIGCEAWVDSKGVLNIEVLQRKPALQLSPSGRPDEGYYVDKDGYIFPLHQNFSTKVRIVEGNIPVKPRNGFRGYPEQEEDSLWIQNILEFDRQISSSRTWNRAIVKTIICDNGDIAIRTDRDWELFIIGNCEELMQRLKGIEFYRKSVAPLKEKGYYKTVNLKYKNQIICRQTDT